ncbi:MAG TPA: hypothetical protein VFD22_06110 [Gemmatimonadaceae bacterium]|jgi:hypothetical protein|nr:hypothetical protein [Gemmatimonadaceae bacterium]
MSEKRAKTEPAHKKPTNKATMDQPQEEFIDPDGAHAAHDIEHGEEVKNAQTDRLPDGQSL